MRLLVAAIAGITLSTPVLAQQYPDKPIRMVIPSAPGGPTDGFTRMIGEGLTAKWGQQIVVDNRGGASGIIGTEIVAKAKPDGYTLLLGNNGPIAVNPSLFRKLPYDAEKDFHAVAQVSHHPNVLVVGPSLPVHSLRDLISLARQKPGSVSYASAGMGSSQHLAGELLSRTLGIELLHVPYKGNGPAMADLLTGQVTMMFSNLPTTVGAVTSGQLKPLGVTSPVRSAAIPDVPTIAEAGVPGYEVMAWLIVMAPAGTPADIINKLNAEIVAICKTERMQQFYKQIGAVTTDRSPAELDRFIAQDRAKWTKIVVDAKIEPES